MSASRIYRANDRPVQYPFLGADRQSSPFRCPGPDGQSTRRHRGRVAGRTKDQALSIAGRQGAPGLRGGGPGFRATVLAENLPFNEAGSLLGKTAERHVTHMVARNVGVRLQAKVFPTASFI
jgi:hypothetical protein